MSELQDYENFIKGDDKNSLLIQDEKTGKRIAKKFTADDLKAYGSFKSYLSELYDNGHKKLVITKRYKSGNTDRQVAGTVAQILTLNKNTNNADLNNQGSNPANNFAGGATQTSQPMQNPYPPSQTQPPGMNAAEAAKLYADSERKKDFENWYKEAKEEAKEFQKKYEALKEKHDDLKFELRKMEKPGAIEKIVNIVSERPEILAGVLESLPKNVTQNQLPEGMTGKADQGAQQLAMAISNLSESDQTNIAKAIDQYQFNNETFITEFEQIIASHDDRLSELYEQNKQSA
jgi:hypothetical protein